MKLRTSFPSISKITMYFQLGFKFLDGRSYEGDWAWLLGRCRGTQIALLLLSFLLSNVSRNY